MDPAIIVTYYETRFRGKRGPYTSDDALQQARQADNDSTERIILDYGESAWRAYYAAKKATKSKHGFKGQAELSNLLKTLSHKPIEQQRIFAQQLASAMERDTSESSQNRETGNNPKKRRLTIDETQLPLTTPSAAIVTATTTITTPPISASPDGVDYRAREQNPNNVIREGVHVNASLTAAKALFPSEFMDSIQRIPNTSSPSELAADVTMFLQEGQIRHNFGCQMEIGISTERVALYAKKLFNVDVETRAGVRYIRYAGGVQIQPDPHIKLRGCQRAAIKDVFGAEMDRGFSAAPIYQREELEKRDHTNGVSMTISNREKEEGRIMLFLGDWHAFDFKKKLYN